MFDEDYGALDRDEYYIFTSRQRIDKAMHTLQGIVEGIVADERVNTAEIRELTTWLGRHLEFSNRHPFNEVIPRLRTVLSDGIVDEDERADLIWLCEKFATDNVYYDEITADMQRLQGFLHGIISDGCINKEELASLSAWVDAHEHLRSCWPYDELESIITHVMKDNRIDDQEHEALLQFFGEFANIPSRGAVGALDRESTVSGVCAMCPEVTFQERFFCFTGASDRSTRDGLAETVRKLNGDFHKNLRNDTHYLVVGAKGNPCWAFACYGRKVEDAVQRRRNGQKLLIVHEFDFWDAVEDAGLA